MTNDNDFGPWIYWAGGECPIPDGLEFQAKSRSGNIYTHENRVYWGNIGEGTIIAYRVRLPADEAKWLIHKDGRGWYLPDAHGYTNSPAAAGRYSYEDAWRHSHPNGLSGPRDGLAIHREGEVAGAGAIPSPPPADDLLRQAIEALRLADQHIQHMGEWIAARKAGYSFESLGEDHPTITAVLTAYDKREQSE